MRAADTLIADLAAANPETPSLRAVRRRYSREWRTEPGAFVLEVGRTLVALGRHEWVGHELIRHHPATFRLVDDALLAAFAGGLDSWHRVDAFARILAGPAWAAGLASDALIDRWSHSPDRWLRRAALVSTVELSDTARVLALGERLAADRDDMVVKALSWALRAHIRHDRGAVRDFLAAHDARLAARVKREVGTKLATGRKT